MIGWNVYAKDLFLRLRNRDVDYNAWLAKTIWDWFAEHFAIPPVEYSECEWRSWL